MPIHPTAVVDRSAEIDPSAEIGAWVVIEPQVRIGPETRVYPHAYICEGTTLGRRCQIHPFAVVGHHPQDVKWKGEPSYTQIGDETIIREHATVHRGTLPGSTTVIGQRCFIMAGGHVAHNAQVGNDVIIANGGLVSGHVQVGDRAFISGNVVVHQFVRIGELAMIGGGTRVGTDVPPFMTVIERNYLVGPNVVGLRRAGFTTEERHEIRRAYLLLCRSGLPFQQAVEQIAQMVHTAPGQRLVEFLRAPSRRGIMISRPSREETPQQALE